MTEKRSAPRLSIGARLRFRINGEDTFCRGELLNLSRSGMLFTSERDLKLGDVIHAVVEEQTPEDGILSVSGEITRIEARRGGRPRYGCKISLSTKT